MRIAKLVFAGSLAAIAAIATPALAKSAERQKADEKAATTTNSPGCQAYQQAADGTWNQLPCGEAGSSGPTLRRAATKGTDDNER